MRRRKVRFTERIIANIASRHLVGETVVLRAELDELEAVWGGKRWTRRNEEAMVAHARLLVAQALFGRQLFEYGVQGAEVINRAIQDVIVPGLMVLGEALRQATDRSLALSSVADLRLDI